MKNITIKNENNTREFLTNWDIFPRDENGNIVSFIEQIVLKISADDLPILEVDYYNADASGSKKRITYSLSSIDIKAGRTITEEEIRSPFEFEEASDSDKKEI